MNAPLHHRDEADLVDLGELTGSVGFLLRLAQVVSFDNFFAGFPARDVTPGEFTVLWVVGLNPGVRQGPLARALRIKPAHMTKLVQRLVTSGLVRRSVPASDRRSVRLSLTGAGRAHCDRHRATFLKLHRAERAGLSDDEAEMLLSLLKKLVFTEPT